MHVPEGIPPFIDEMLNTVTSAFVLVILPVLALVDHIHAMPVPAVIVPFVLVRALMPPEPANPTFPPDCAITGHRVGVFIDGYGADSTRLTTAAMR